MSVQQSTRQYSTTWIMLLALLTSLGPLSIDMYLPALPQMAQDFGVSTQMVANTLPAYFLGLALGQLIYGPLSDRIGRKTPLYFGLTLYVVASLLCIFAVNEWSLIAARILQAVGGCVGVVIARAAIRDRLDMQASAQAFASMMIVMGIAPVIAPSLGAVVLKFFAWQVVFGFLMLIGLICLVCVHFFFKESLPAERRLKLNVAQIIQLYGSIFKDPSFKWPMLAGCFSGGILFCYISSSAAVLMDDYGLTQQQFAYAFGLNAFGIMLLSTLNKKLGHQFSVLNRLKIGSVIQLLGASILFSAGLIGHSPLWVVLIGMFWAVAGIGFTGPNAMALAMAEQGAQAGTASAIMGSMQFACGLLGGVILNFLVWNSLLNMGVLMLIFVGVTLLCILQLSRQLQNRRLNT
ncbi:multidrug effflux MFS transporter [Acinetobacter sp. C_4_1]|uniref:multidrug effflux MFS transporter n=1 Tax=unclassified Acinetobacter TaxID=196816 RepID=UPI0021B7F96A|nr:MULTISPECIES: multidrug effflux MFS transporter [unclassified Acinetobacter]MCT8089652.1 multidrug effflux MFS transporter [Acinetobacter sp. F_3_1]MCT8099056.1 multidrug effflux MFS transporter [Acinetobacter sp. C_3_1]MCT8101873.1 multidrug effflux MFS transporter [Acinetobacter sp. C_4_1]MCT8134930.1 multidrug effflux MFS transporter [Acinetobacter sp. T_3_1]